MADPPPASKPIQAKTSNDLISAFRIAAIQYDQAMRVISTQEGQFGDVKGIEIAPAKISKTASAFANADGGDLYVGISEETRTNVREWRGFDDQEAANGLIQVFERLFPLGQDADYEFLRCADCPGLVLHVQVQKTKSIVVRQIIFPTSDVAQCRIYHAIRPRK